MFLEGLKIIQSSVPSQPCGLEFTHLIGPAERIRLTCSVVCSGDRQSHYVHYCGTIIIPPLGIVA